MGHIRRVLEASPFHGEGDRKVWAKRRVEGMRTSQERVRRLMRAHDLQAPHRGGQAHGPTAHDGTITTETPDVMWGTDMTATVTVGEGAACVFVVRSFETIEDLRLAVLAFKRTYNEQWMLEKYAYRSPAQVRRDLVGLDAAA